MNFTYNAEGQGCLSTTPFIDQENAKRRNLISKEEREMINGRTDYLKHMSPGEYKEFLAYSNFLEEKKEEYKATGTITLYLNRIDPLALIWLSKSGVFKTSAHSSKDNLDFLMRSRDNMFSLTDRERDYVDTLLSKVKEDMKQTKVLDYMIANEA